MTTTYLGPYLSSLYASPDDCAVLPRGQMGLARTKLVDLTIIGRQHAALNFAFLFGLFLFLLLLLSLWRLETLAKFRNGGPKETIARVKQAKPSRAGSHNGSRMTTPWPARHPRATHLPVTLSLSPLPSLLGPPLLSQAHPWALQLYMGRLALPNAAVHYPFNTFINCFACLVSQQVHTWSRSLFSSHLKTGTASETGMELSSVSAQLKTFIRPRFSSLADRPWCGVETMYFADEDKI